MHEDVSHVMLVCAQVLEGLVPCPPAYKVTATSVANKGEPFRSGLSDSKQAVQDFMDTVTGTGGAEVWEFLNGQPGESQEGAYATDHDHGRASNSLIGCIQVWAAHWKK
jgi:hypothetical protein